MEEKVGPFTFISNFDSGNLARVERVKTEDASSSPEDCDGAVVINPDFDYNVWTAPDCAGTEFENQNRTWFYFGIKGGQPGKLLRINILNLNRQGKLYGQGMTPLVKVVPSRNKWERIRDKPKYETVDGQFRLSFTYRFPDQRSGIHYFAFCYPYSYSDCQAKLDDLDRSFTICQQMTPSEPKDSIYFYRELLCYTLDSLRVDLLTITSAKGMMEEREESLPSLFPDKTVPRAHKFEGKKVFFLSARVHPGETPSSFVFNGFLDFILRQDDPRAAALRDQYVFKLIPMLNPDGVKRGHYRTDQRGVNLNRVYMDPDPLLHPSIFAAKSIILYHHTIGNLHQDSDHHNACVCDTEKAKKVTVNLNTTSVETGSEFFTNKDILDLQSVPSELKPELPEPESVKMDFISVEGNGMIDKDANNNKNKETLSSNLDSLALKMSPDVQTGASNDALQMDTVVSNQLSNESTSSMSSDCHSEKQLNTRTLDQPQFKTVLNKKEPANCIYCSSQTSSEQSSGVAYYVDLHGHASKRGCFVYANYLENEDNYVSSILFPKLISLNSTNFDFAACNFTEKNMYSKDKRDGMSKEGSGRVAIYKATGIIHSYTLECNYNCGRTVNCLPPATCDNGCATPPPLPGFPPKYTPEIYEEVGRAMAVAVLDMNNTNPWTRLPLSEFTSLEGVKNWVRRFVKSSKNAPSVPKKLSRVITKTSSMVAGATASTRQKLSALASSSSDMSSDNAASGGHRTTDHPSQNGTNVNKETGKKPATDTVRRPYHLASTQKTSLQGTGAQSGKSGKNHHDDTCSSSPGTLSGANRRDQLSGPGPLRATVFKAKEQPRVSLELPKTGPTLRLVHNLRHQPQGHVQPTSLSSKSLSSPVEIKMSTIDVHKQFISFHRSKPGVALRNGHSSQSDEEKKKKNVRPRRKNGRKKEKNGEAVARDEIQPSEISSSRPPVAEDIHVSTVEKEEEGKSKSTNLSRRNSSKNMISCSMMSCEVVDIKELPHTPQSGSGTNPLTFWPNTSVS